MKLLFGNLYLEKYIWEFIFGIFLKIDVFFWLVNFIYYIRDKEVEMVDG